MKKLNTSLITSGVGYPPAKKGWDFLMQSYTEVVAELAKTLFNGTYAANTPYVLYGCVKTLISGSNYSYTAGQIFYNGEIFEFPAVASISITTSDVCTITTTADPTADPTEMSDGSTVNIHNVRAIVLSNAASVTNGATQFNFSSCVFSYGAYSLSDSYLAANTGTWTGVNATTNNLVKWSRYRNKLSMSFHVINSNLSAASVASVTIKLHDNMPLPNGIYTGMGWFNNNDAPGQNVDAAGDKGRCVTVMQTANGSQYVTITCATYNNFYGTSTDGIELYGTIEYYI